MCSRIILTQVLVYAYNTVENEASKVYSVSQYNSVYRTALLNQPVPIYIFLYKITFLNKFTGYSLHFYTSA